MKIAIPEWNGRISPVLDAARHLLLIDIEDGQDIRRSEAVLHEESIPSFIADFADLQVDVLLCGAVSRSLLFMLTASGTRVFPHLSGGVEDVLAAFLDGSLEDPGFAAPGCGRRQQRRRGRRGNRRIHRRENGYESHCDIDGRRSGK